MKVLYVSAFDQDTHVFADYSSRFLEALEHKYEVVPLEVGDLAGRECLSTTLEVRRRLREAVAQYDGIEIVYIELVHQFLSPWAVALWKRDLGGAKLVGMIHDSPVPAVTPLMLFAPWYTELLRKGARFGDLIGLSGLVNRVLLSRLDQVFFLSEAGRGAFCDKYASSALETSVLKHVSFPEPRIWSGQQERVAGELVIFFAGTWWTHKGIEDLLESASLAVEGGQRVRLVLSGSGNARYVEKVKARCELLESENLVIELLGKVPIDEMYARGRGADCWVVPYKKVSTVSGSGIIMHGMASGAHLVVSDLPQFQEVLTDGVNCTMYAEGDVTALSHAILSSLDSDYNERVRAGMMELNMMHAPLRVLEKLDDESWNETA